MGIRNEAAFEIDSTVNLWDIDSIDALLITHPEDTRLFLDSLHNVEQLLDCPRSEQRSIRTECEPQDGLMVSYVVKDVLDCDVIGIILYNVF